MLFRRLTALAMLTGLAMALGASVSEAAPLKPIEARIIDNFEQLGIDTAAPRFGWVVSDPVRGAVQSAYQIVVARSQAELDSTNGLVWDSGKVASSDQYGVAYAGAALEKTSEYWWKVRTWDAQGQPSPWSDAGHFVTSFFKPQDWNAQAVWISDELGTVPPTKPAPQFRKEFQINKPIRGAYLYICGLGQFTAQINDARVRDHVMDPAWTDYDMTSDYVTFDLKGREANGLVTYGLGDWMAPGGNDVRNVEGAIYVYDTGLVRDIATALGKADDASTYAKEYTRVRDAYNRAYFDPQTKSYQPLKQANEALPLAFGIVPDGEIEAVQQALANVIAHPPEGPAGKFGPVVANHVTTGDIATSALWQALGDAGQGTLVQTMIMQETTPSYMYMINHGATTVAENWLYEKTRSHNHDMYAGIMAYLYRSVGGISALKPGYEVIQIKPCVPLGLNSAAATYDSVRGPIETSWQVEGNAFTLKVRVPANASAIVTVPAVDADAVLEGGQPAKNVQGVKFLRFESSAAVFSVGSGSYSFQSTAKK